MDHSTIISLNFRNMITIVFMVTVGWFCLHLIGKMATGAGLTASYSGGVNYAGDVGATL